VSTIERSSIEARIPPGPGTTAASALAVISPVLVSSANTPSFAEARITFPPSPEGANKKSRAASDCSDVRFLKEGCRAFRHPEHRDRCDDLDRVG
jgi:hypothetical protein